jgi:hypothetical protein
MSSTIFLDIVHTRHGILLLAIFACNFRVSAFRLENFQQQVTVAFKLIFGAMAHPGDRASLSQHLQQTQGKHRVPRPSVFPYGTECRDPGAQTRRLLQGT